ncbi:hypothetical protein HYT55_00815 [Candidatus Woesearchaeota archaeon]|nr:hypothetical protein [Candidatus Woesearchaeota archaeon]
MERELRCLGLTQYETSIYCTLIARGKLSAQEIAGFSKVPPTAVYPNIKSLLDKKLIQQFAGKVRAFEALNPEMAIPALIEEKRKNLLLLQHEVVQRAKIARNSQHVAPTKEVIQLAQGREISEAIYHSFEERAQKSLYIMGWFMYKVKDKYTHLRRLQKLVKKHVDVRLLVIGRREKQWSVIEAYQKAGIPVRYVPLENFSLAVCDGTECKITLKSKELAEKMHVLVNDKDLAAAMQSYFLMTWEKAEEIGRG